MKKHTLTYILALVLIFSCHRDQRTPFTETIFIPQKDSITPLAGKTGADTHPDTLQISMPSPVPALTPYIHQASHQQQRALVIEKIPADNPDIYTPGQNGIPEAIIVAMADSARVAAIPLMAQANNPFIPPNNSQSFSFYTRQQGLHHDDISSLVMGKDGSIWMGTYGSGAIRFDGLNFYQYDLREGLPQNYILSMLAARNGDIWMGTRAEGAVRFDGTHFYYFNIRNGLSNNRVEAIFEDSRGNIWLGTYNGVSKYNGSEIINYRSEHGINADIVYTIQEDKDQNIWLGTRGGGIAKFDGTSFHNYNTSHGLVCNYIVTGTTDSKGNLWFGSFESGMCMFDGQTFHHFNQSQGLVSNNVRALQQDRLGNIWIGSSEGGLSRLSGSQLTIFDEDHGLINSFATCFLEDSKGIMWFGTYGGGLGKYRGDIFTHFWERHGIPNGFVRSMVQDQNGYMWLGTNNMGVLRFDGNEFINYTTHHGLSHNRVGGMVQDKNGNLWFATTGGGISLFDGQSFTNITESEGLNDDFILHNMIDSKGNIWFVTRNNGVIKYDGTHFLSYSEKQGLGDNNARVIVEDQQGRMWIGTRAGGVSVLDGDTFYHYTTETGLLSNNILDMLCDSKGNIWIGTNGQGTSKIEGGFIVHYTEREGLINNFVYSLLEDKEGQILMGTRMGLSRLLESPGSGERHTAAAQQTDPGSILFKNYTQREGYLGIGSNSRAMYQDNQGKIWIGANDILTVYNPANDLTDSLPPFVNLTFLGLFNEHVQWDKLLNRDTTFLLANGVEVKRFRFDEISPLKGLPVNLKLFHRNNYITFGFVAISSSPGEGLRYRYILEGIDNQWSSLGQRTEISYANLSPGKYTFRVNALNSDGFWGEEHSYSFRITPPVWRTWYAYTLYFVLALAAIYLLQRQQQVRLLQKEQEKQRELFLKQEVAIARKAAEFKQNFLANMSHEIRTPLTGVIGMANLLSNLPLDDKAREYVEALNKSGESLKETINMILDISKIEAGKLKLKRHDFSLHDVINDAIKLFSPLCYENVSITTQIGEDIPPFIYSDQQRVSQVIKNLLSNAVKFTHEGTITIYVSIDSPPEKDDENQFFIKISVCDTGTGIEYHEQKKLFTPFYQAGQDFVRTSEGTGLGLAISKELTILLGGQIGLTSKPGKGSCFWFTLKTREGKQPGAPSDKDGVKPSYKQRSANILLVEDKDLISKVVTMMLNALGHSVVKAENGEEALKKFKPGSFDLILMDIQMPVMDGITATHLLKERYKDLPPIVGLSANAFEGDRQKYMEKGLDDYLTKPFEEKDFIELLNRLGLS